MDLALPDATVSGYAHLIETIELPDDDDRHIVAAAIHCGARVIVTRNLADFPSTSIVGLHIEVQHPDDFVLALLEVSPDLVIEAARNHRASLHNPAKTIDEYLAELLTQVLTRTVASLRALSELKGIEII